MKALDDLRRAIRRRRHQRRIMAPKLLAAFAEAYPQAVFVEIGSNDGEQHDHLRPFILEHDWRGVMVEPVPHVFERLVRNYAGVEGLAFENAAIADADGSRPFFHLVPRSERPAPGLPDWYDGLGSFSRETVLGHRVHIPDVEDRLVEREVPTLTFATLCDRHGLDEVDLLAVDTEGYDAEILRSIDFTRRRPRLVLYEHYHLSPEERRACRERMERAGYETREEGFDTFCLVPREDELHRRWRRLRPGVEGVAAYEEDR